MEITEALARLGGIATSAQLVASADRHSLRQAAHAGTIAPAGPGRWALPTAHAAHVAAARLSGVVSHASAAAHWGFWLAEQPTRPVVTVPRNRNVAAERRTGVDLRYDALPDGRVVTLANEFAPDAELYGVRVRVTDPLTTVLACARSLPLERALPVADSALRSGRITRGQLVTAAERSPRTGRAAAVRVASAADARSDSVLESVTRAISLTVPGLRLEPQVTIGPNMTADLVDRRLRLVVECDSFAFHADRIAFRRDIERYNTAVRRGWVVVRVAWEHAVHQPDYVRGLLADVAQRPHQQPPRWS